MSDEDLFSLDFTAPGVLPAVESTPAPTAAPEPPKKLVLELIPHEGEAVPAKAAPAPATPAAKPPPKPAAPAVPAPPALLLEAADLHAGGDYLGASKKLEAALKTGARLGNFVDAVWQGLFEVLHDLQRREIFEKLALTYAQHFEKSPPTWVEEEVVESDSATADGAAFRLPAGLTAAAGPALKEMMQSARSVLHLSIDVSQVRQVDDDGATLALRAMKALEGAKREYELIGAEALARHLGETLVPMERKNEAQWLLLIALFDSLDQQDAFEEAAVNYAVTFEVSPPSWETRVDRPKPAGNPAAAASAPPAGIPALRGEVLAPADALVRAIDASPDKDIVLDAQRLKRIEKSAAQKLLDCLKRRKEAGVSITVSGLPQLPLILLTQMGWPDVASLKLRKL